jgi:glycosyltransferase involved in cell wall biosynthesis
MRMVERGADPGRIKVISNVIDETTLKTSVEKFSTKSRDLTLIMHGSIEKRYGHELVIRAVNKLKGNYPDLLFKIIGYGSYTDNLKMLVSELSCENNVLFLGYLSFEELEAELNMADVGLISMYKSPYSELIDTNKMYEFISLGIPVIHSRLQPVLDNFDDSCFLYFEPGNYQDLANCIEKLYSTPDLRTELTKNAYKKYESLKWDIEKIKLQNMIENIINF